MGWCCSETGNDDLAIDYHLRSLAALEQANLPFQVANALDNLAETYGERQQWEKAEAYKLRSYAIREKGTNPYIKLLTQLSMARLYIHTHRYPVAELHLAQATQMAGQHYPALLYEVHRDQALLHMHTQAWPQAIAALQLFWQNRKQAGDKTDLTHAHLQLGLCYTATQQYKEADKHLQTALATAHRQKSLKQLEKIYEALSALAREQQQHKEALEYLQLYNHYREQRINQTTEHRIVLMQMQYETQKKDEEIAALRQQLQAGHTPAVAAQYGLSPREREILQLLVAGNSYKAMAQALRIEYETVRTHLKRLYAKLSVSNNTEAVAKAVKEGLV
ncbi:MAG: tetratricopeptide repeat protein [Bacteroidetes bacterium]|nr:tetratricopeptide repeat protein [Bacteroidota bacterium]